MTSVSPDPASARQSGLLIAVGRVTGDERDTVCERTVGDRDAQRRRRGQPGRDPRDDVDGDTGGVERREFLAAAPEHERVAALEPHHAIARARFANQKLLDERLRRRATTAALAHRDEARGRTSHREDPGRNQVVMQHDVGSGEGTYRLQGEKLGITGSGADEHNTSRSACCAPHHSSRPRFVRRRRSGATRARTSRNLCRIFAATARPLAPPPAGHRVVRAARRSRSRQRHGSCIRRAPASGIRAAPAPSASCRTERKAATSYPLRQPFTQPGFGGHFAGEAHRPQPSRFDAHAPPDAIAWRRHTAPRRQPRARTVGRDRR